MNEICKPSLGLRGKLTLPFPLCLSLFLRDHCSGLGDIDQTLYYILLFQCK